MIGLVFALQKTFGTSDGIQSTGFVRVLGEFAARRGLDVDAITSNGSTVDEAASLSSSGRIREAFSTALRPYLVDAQEAAALEAMFRMETARLVDDRFVPYADVAPTLGELAALNIPCVGLSGGWPSIDQRKADIAGFSGLLVFAEDLGVAAGAPGAFARVAQTLRLPADRIWFVGTDARAEVLPAAAAGLRTIWINRDRQTFPADRTAPDATIASFAEILGVVSESYTRGLLALRYILRTALDWRPGHFIPTDEPLARDESAKPPDLGSEGAPRP